MALNNVVLLGGVKRVKMSETGVCALWSEAGRSIRRCLLISGFSPHPAVASHLFALQLDVASQTAGSLPHNGGQMLQQHPQLLMRRSSCL